MVCTSFINTNMKTKITDKDLENLFNKSKYIRNNYIVIERIFERKVSMFKKELYMVYDIYYKLKDQSDNSWIGDVQCIGLPGGLKYNNVYAYFLGIASAEDKLSKGH